ncbi:hypothetical protein [Paenibacillus physcomitrellae]|uniref:DUF1292 domain-containing protein n=1 Tax=Paenibacillus physcomitrellae TaxID=1619311 RepID=A0ABQ1GQN1_9BACL|nr:hypothetical protein [Paenibacillus physcomitrellae]GGA48084.1 hypothetical protein GCM10010917_36740 [Paenibacillus physcomitrellae]
MNMIIKNAEMNKDSEGAFLGKTVFEVEGHTQPYEITFYSKKGKDWDYSLHFHAEPGEEEKLLVVDAFIEESEEAFDNLLDAALDANPEL